MPTIIQDAVIQVAASDAYGESVLTNFKIKLLANEPKIDSTNTSCNDWAAQY